MCHIRGIRLQALSFCGLSQVRRQIFFDTVLGNRLGLPDSNMTPVGAG